jgi:hypothetical protein
VPYCKGIPGTRRIHVVAGNQVVPQILRPLQ